MHCGPVRKKITKQFIQTINTVSDIKVKTKSKQNKGNNNIEINIQKQINRQIKKKTYIQSAQLKMAR